MTNINYHYNRRPRNFLRRKVRESLPEHFTQDYPKLVTFLEKYYEERINSLDFKSSEDKIVESFENYLREKFFALKNNQELEKKLKSYKKDLNEKFKGKIGQLNEFTLKIAFICCIY